MNHGMKRYYIDLDDNCAIVRDGTTGECVWSKNYHYDGWIGDLKNPEIGGADDQARKECARLNAGD